MNKRQRKKRDKKLVQQWDESGYEARSYLRGHEIKWDGVEWLYLDATPARTNKPCAKCGKAPTPEGHDACLGHIDGAKAACCGHGIEGDAYVWYEGEEEEVRG